jgi:hypothetical protein
LVFDQDLGITMKPEPSSRPMSRGEKETETEATRLIEHIEEALALVAIRSSAEIDSLAAVADRIERAARDLSAALRELAEQRRIAQNAAE